MNEKHDYNIIKELIASWDDCKYADPEDDYMFGYNDGVDLAINTLSVMRFEQKKGRWIVVSDGYGNGEATACVCECSECKDTIWVYKNHTSRTWNFCPTCGTPMEQEIVYQ